MPWRGPIAARLNGLDMIYVLHIPRGGDFFSPSLPTHELLPDLNFFLEIPSFFAGLMLYIIPGTY